MSGAILRELVESALMSSAAVALVLFLRRTVRFRFGAVLAYGAWSLVPISLIATLLPHATVPLPGIAFAPALQLPLLQSPTRAADHALWLLSAWGVGALLFAGTLVRQQLRFVTGLGNTIETAQASATMSVLRAESTVGCPVLIGILRPRIVLPSDFETRYTDQEMNLILAHEQAHLHRGDIYANALCALLRCVFWFNPLLHIAANAFRFDQELACDATVVRRYPDSRRCYAEAMLKTHMADAGLPAGCHWQSHHPLKERIMFLKRPLPNRVSRICGQMSLAALAIAVGYGAWAAQPAGTPSTADSLQQAAQNTDDASGKKIALARRQLELVQAGYEMGTMTRVQLEQARLAYAEAEGRDTALLRQQLAGRLLERAEKRFEVGLITATQLDQARAAYEKASNELVSTE